MPTEHTGWYVDIHMDNRLHIESYSELDPLKVMDIVLEKWPGMVRRLKLEKKTRTVIVPKAIVTEGGRHINALTGETVGVE
jgi:hypothetical protein